MKEDLKRITEALQQLTHQTASPEFFPKASVPSHDASDTHTQNPDTDPDFLGNPIVNPDRIAASSPESGQMIPAAAAPNPAPLSFKVYPQTAPRVSSESRFLSIRPRSGRPASPQPSPQRDVPELISLPVPASRSQNVSSQNGSSQESGDRNPQTGKAAAGDSPTDSNDPKILDLFSFSEPQPEEQPTLATDILQDLSLIVQSWQRQLSQVVQQIQTLYLEGPIVDGWLESQPEPSQDALQQELRHLDIDRLMDYVDELCQSTHPPESVDLPTEATVDSVNSLLNATLNSHLEAKLGSTDYRLCGLDEEGQIWSRPCPAEQVVSVSLAIARYHKFRELLSTKQSLEGRLQTLSQTLVELRDQLQKS